MQEDFWKREEIPTTDRGLEVYLKELGLSGEMLEGKTILDVGSGTRKFAKEVKDAGINADVISLDPAYASPETKFSYDTERGVVVDLKERLQKTDVPGVKDKSLAGVGEALPFKDDTFDLVVADTSLPAYGTNEQIDAFFAEVFRVLKNDGELRFNPPHSMWRRGPEYPLKDDLTAITNSLGRDSNFKFIEGESGEHFTVLRKISSSTNDERV